MSISILIVFEIFVLVGQLRAMEMRASEKERERERETFDPFGGPPHARRETAKPLC